MNTLVSTVRRRRRAATAAMLALAGLPLLVTSGAEAALITECPTESPCVIVKVISKVDGKKSEYRYPVVIDEQADLTEENELAYKVRAKKAGPTESIGGITKALSLQEILKNDNGTDAVDWRFSETPNRAETPSVLSRDFTYWGGLVPAVYVAPDGGVGYIRPLRREIAKDVNVGDVFTLPPGQPLFLTIHVTGDLLDVGITASPKKITTKTPVSFTATIDPETDEKLKYEWNFVGTSKIQSRKAAPSWPYTKRDTYAVNLTVRGDDGSYGRAATTTIKVGNPPKPPKTPGNGGSGDGIGGGGGGSGYIPPFVPNSPTIPSDGLPNEEPPIDDFPTAPVDDGLEQVEGFVLAGAGSEQGESIPGTDAAAQPTEASELSTTRKISGAAIGALAVLLLLGLGAEIETRWLSTRLGHLRRRA